MGGGVVQHLTKTNRKNKRKCRIKLFYSDFMMSRSLAVNKLGRVTVFT